MNITEIVKKYDLTKQDAWLLQRGGKSIWILTHDACEKIANIENIKVDNIKVLNSEKDFVRFIITVCKDDIHVSDVGEATKENCQSNYYGCMALKRGFDRGVLKLINAYEFGIYSESESDDFKNNEK